MSAEHNSPTPVELKQFRLTFEKVKYTAGLTLDLANSAEDTVSGFRRTYSPIIPHASEKTIKEALGIFAKEFVVEDAREEMWCEPHSHHDDIISEWPTKDPHVVFGVKRIVDQRGESGKTWYLRNTEKKPSLISKLAKKLQK